MSLEKSSETPLLPHSKGRRGQHYAAPLVTGFIFGFGLGTVLLSFTSQPIQQSLPVPLIHSSENTNISQEVSTQHLNEDYVHLDLDPQGLANQVRVLCWIMTSPSNHKTRAVHVKRTWGKRCNILLFMSTANDTELQSVALNNLREGRRYLWAKTKEAFKYIYQNYFDKADWFVKADDDTYVIMENLRLFLKDKDPKAPIYFGCKFKEPTTQQIYMSGGAGYVLSKEALQRFVEKAIPSKEKCWGLDDGNEDFEIGRCLQSVGVEAGDSRDSLGRYRFLAYDLEKHLIPGEMNSERWYSEYIYYPQKEGANCCSDTVVSFHYIMPNTMYILEYLLYSLKHFVRTWNQTVLIDDEKL
ncbi:unnamed protein product [Orchesella dallaii]|uniref:N-acetylgalactosaminide beta-1,3-galactosyltransferase n=1 Tax=Orchesella dallaii TaxID=48710 RepID=A0ABP1RGP8_9HEXA